MRKALNLYLLASLFISNFTLFAQPGGGGETEGGDPAPGAPIQNKLIYLAIVGIAFAFYMYNRNRKLKTA